MKMSRRLTYLLYLVLAMVLWGLYYVLNTQLRLYSEYRPPRNISILLWHWPYRYQHDLDGDVCWEQFRVPSCLLHDSRAFFNQSDVVVFHHHELKTHQQRLPLQLRRPPTQKWLWMSMEAPASNRNLTAYNGHFNWTMSYRRDADVFVPYGELVPRRKASGPGPGRGFIHANKSSLACWVVSNYKPHHRRIAVYKKLRKLIPVEVYGRWMKRPLTDSNLLPTISSCYFYLAFENTQSRDYITEKFWRNSLQAGAVPVVLGPPRSNYEDFAPPGSFIHVDDFGSVEALARFLQQVASNETQYASYFAWRQDHEVKLYMDWIENLCRICTVYHTLPPNKVHENLQEWANVLASV